jgi:catechol 2,3-dioxygenase-like lactoylglutathione lyase family enzyme
MKPVITGLFHVAIKTLDLDATKTFWLDVLGLTEIARPNFGYPGAWFGVPTPGGLGIIHIYAGGPALSGPDSEKSGTAAIDHVSLTAIGYHEFIARFREHGADWREFLVPGTTLWQLFVYDPSGVQLELTFDGRVEEGEGPDMSEGRVYVAGRSFFKKG